MAVRRLAEIQPDSFEFSPENQKWVDKQIAKYPAGRQASAVMGLLRRAQEQNGGWVSKPAIEKIAVILGMPDIRVLEIATFYSMYNLGPVGKYFIQMCGTTPCMLRGSDDIKAVLQSRIGNQDTVTADGLFSWLEVECLGACCNAPMVQINDDYYEDLTPENFNKLLDDLAAGREVKRGSQSGRVTSEPVGGLTTLTGLYGQDGHGGSYAASKGAVGASAGTPAASADQDNAQAGQPSMQGGIDFNRENTLGKPQRSIADTGTRTDDPVGAHQIESSALTQDTPQQAAERQERSSRDNPPVPGPAGNTSKEGDSNA